MVGNQQKCGVGLRGKGRQRLLVFKMSSILALMWDEDLQNGPGGKPPCQSTL